MKTSTRLITAVIAVLVVSVTMSVLSAAQNVDAQEVAPSREKTISVTGTATSSVQPDQLNISFGVETQQKTAKEALDSNSIAMNNVIEAIRTAGVTDDEIGTSNFSIYPIYDGYEEPLTKRWTQELKGYQITNTITVKTFNLTLAADIIDAAVNAGTNRVDSVSFTLSPEKHMQLKDELIEQAIQNAKTKAEKALTPLDYSVVGVKSVSLSEFGIPVPTPMFNMAFDEGMAVRSSTPVFSSSQDVTSTANVVFLIESNQ